MPNIVQQVFNVPCKGREKSEAGGGSCHPGDHHVENIHILPIFLKSDIEGFATWRSCVSFVWPGNIDPLPYLTPRGCFLGLDKEK